jgi:hypothetical protein
MIWPKKVRAYKKRGKELRIDDIISLGNNLIGLIKANQN